MQDKYQEVLIVLIASTIVFFVLAITFVFILFFYQKKKFLHQKQLTEAELKYTEQLLLSRLEIQEQTLKNISQEIHDNIGQSLSLVKLHLNTMDTGQPATLGQKISDSRELVSKAIRDLRQLSHSLDADQISRIGLLNALEAELEQVGRAGTHQTRLVTDGTPYRIDKQKELLLFRIVQEALHNIIKHAEASSITLHFGFTPAGLELRIIDDGKGFDIPLHETNENVTFGVGIRNMHDRANLIGATFHISSTRKTGTIVTLYLSQTIKPN